MKLPVPLCRPGCRWPLLLLLLLAGLGARAQTWQNVQPLCLPEPVAGSYFVTHSRVLATVSANGSVYVAGVQERLLKRRPSPHGGSHLLGLTAFVAKWDPRTRRLVWRLEMTRLTDPQEDYGKEEAVALVVRGQQVYVLGDFEGYTFGFGHPLKASGQQDAFVARLTDHGARATADWVQPLGGGEGATTWAHHLALAGRTLYVAGTTTTYNGRFDPATGSQVGVDTARAFVVRLTDGTTRAVPGWQHRWVVPPYGLHALTALVVRGRSLYLAENTWQLTSALDDTAEIRVGGTLVPARRHRLRLTCLRDAGRTCQPTWTWGSAGYAHDLAATTTALYLVGYDDYQQPFGPAGLPAYPRGQGHDLLLAKLRLTASGPRPGWVRRLPGTGYHEHYELRYVAARGRQVFVAGTFGASGLALGSHRLHRVPASGPPTQDIFVAQLTDTGPAGRFDWAERIGGADADELQDFALAGSRLYVRGLVSGYPGTPVVVGRQQLPMPLAANEQVLLQAWRPVGPAAYPPTRRPAGPRPGSPRR